MAALAEELVGLTVLGAIAGIGAWLARGTLFARFAEFDGQVIRQWVVKGDDSPDEYHVAIDDGIARQGVGPGTSGASPTGCSRRARSCTSG